MFNLSFISSRSKDEEVPPIVAVVVPSEAALVPAQEVEQEKMPSSPPPQHDHTEPAVANESNKQAETSSSDPPRRTSFQESFEDNDTSYDDDDDEEDQSPTPTPKKLKKRPPRLGRIDSQRINYDIPTNEGVDEHVKRYQGHDSWRYKIVKFIHSKKVQYFLMGLLLLDVLILFVEMFLLATYPMCNLIERDGISCCPAEDQKNTRFLGGGGGGYEDICPAGTIEFGKASCDTHKWHDVHVAEKVFVALTILILSTFFVELNVEMIAVTPSVFFRQVFLLFDYTIVTVSLGLELMFVIKENLNLQSAVGLIIVARLWRFVRIAHGIVEVVTEISSTKYQDLLAYAESLEVMLKDNGIVVPDIPSIRKLKMLDDNILSEIEYEHRSHHFKKHHSMRHLSTSSSAD
mmetsp:Transcript_578/g.1034  ORF Transcript_578/g.1034 Transcript_578/m.1034 type:complete len:404 (+) Transcript_578:250-1461(+)|eukprot:CAMPEP_0176490268 /NCGR_PEP_ID=MMETSP0200_2-20121128/7777_1 /TAXON_ID=947934 /ORGANISM="Chaetoceros sp., Strain GSL56" /LENGTH=403 /DNA_ID=CAMNT_0017887557 /DNA_START=242 /DNA_END=1453 /DNA_ORIENTATION=+